jgi:single-stranded-DNA-specific exonuclease
LSKEWIIAPPWPQREAAARQWAVAPLVAQLLHNRAVTSADDARGFLDPRMTGLHPPKLLTGAESAAARLAAAIRAGQRIVLYGDYDVDGITGVAILWHLLRHAGAEVSFYVPHRVDEGYGLNQAAIKSLADDGADVIVSVDCGITALAVADEARRIGVDLIITDHHEPRDTLPDAVEIVHPRVGSPYPNADLCGAGVAFKLAWALAQQLSGAERVDLALRKLLTDLLPLAALGTIADIVPLIGENRILTACGLALLGQSPFPGIRALLEVAGLNGSAVSGTDVGFRIAPRLNAAGRMGHARLAIELLTRADENRAREIALYLDDHNRARQNMQRKQVRRARELVEKHALDGDANRAIVLADEDWHAGVIGIVASNLVERYHKPVVLIALEGDEGHGSARSVPYFPMHEALAACGEHLLSHGGHAMAGGIKITAQSVPAFTDAFVRHANNTLSGSALRPRLHIDGEVDLHDLDEATVTALHRLQPFGAGNPKPILATDWVELADDPRCVGKSGEHLQLSVRQNGSLLRGIAFRAAEHADALKDHRRCRLAFEPIINEFQGRRRVELQVVDFKFPDTI